MSNELKELIQEYLEKTEEVPHKPDLWEIKEYLNNKYTKIKDKDPLSLSLICWVNKRLYYNEETCNYSNKDIISKLDEEALIFLKTFLLK